MLDQILNSRVTKKIGCGLDDHNIGRPARCDGATSIVRRIHPERADTYLAQFGADGGTHCPICCDYKNN
jgi:hypothetical protein